jgi:hypothetical protein
MVQDDRQAQVKQRLVTQRWRKGTGRQADSGTGSGQAGGYRVRQRSKTRRARETRVNQVQSQNAGRFEQTRRTGNRQTENTGINTQAIMGKMGDTWRGWRKAQGQVKQIRA